MELLRGDLLDLTAPESTDGQPGGPRTATRGKEGGAERLEPEAEAEPEAGAECEDVEGSLDEILRERLKGRGADEDEAEDGELLEPARRGTFTDADVIPPSAEEFVCRSCYLIKRRSQLADAERVLCMDCLNSY